MNIFEILLFVTGLACSCNWVPSPASKSHVPPSVVAPLSLEVIRSAVQLTPRVKEGLQEAVPMKVTSMSEGGVL